MDLPDDVKMVEMEIFKESDKSCSFKGTLQLLVDYPFGLVLTSLITIKECLIDLYTTKSWFKDKRISFKRRDELFKLLNLKQKERPTQSSNLLFKLNDSQIETLNNYLKKLGQSFTIKSLLTLLQGNNPTGEASSPKSAQLWTYLDGKKVGFSLLIKNMRVSKNYRIPFQIYNDYNKITFKDWLNFNSKIKNWFNILQQEKSHKEYKLLQKVMQKEVKTQAHEYQNWLEGINKERAIYAKNIEQKFSDIVKAFKYYDRDDYDYAHIKSVALIKEECLGLLNNNNYTESNKSKILKQISDPNNFLPLPKSIHRKFDRYEFSYRNGQLYNFKLKREQFMKLKEELQEHNLNPLHKSFYTKKREQYLNFHFNKSNELRDKNI